MLKIDQKRVLEFSDFSEIDFLYKKAFGKARRLDIFKGEAVDFYIGMADYMKDSLKFYDEFQMFLSYVEQYEKWRFPNKPSFEEYNTYEENKISMISRLEKQKKYLNLTLLFRYSLVIEAAINRDSVMKDDLGKKNNYLSLGLKFKNTNLSWIQLVSSASNYSRHHAEWIMILGEVSKCKGPKLEKLQELTKKNNGARESISNLMELSSFCESFESRIDTVDISEILIKELGLLDFEKSFRRIELWLLRLELTWADQFFPNQKKYLGFE